MGDPPVLQSEKKCCKPLKASFIFWDWLVLQAGIQLTFKSIAKKKVRGNLGGCS